MASKETNELLKEIIDDIKKDIDDEDIIHFLLDQKLSKNTNSIDKKQSFG